jgi:hypothetical protein
MATGATPSRRVSAVVKKQLVFGAADGVAAVIGLVALTGQPHALVKAAIGVGLAELVGMTAGAWLSADEAETGFWHALANGTAAFTCVTLPAFPFLFLHGWEAVAAALGVIVAIGAGITLMRSERGWAAVAKTYGVLLVAAVVCVAAAFI